MDDVSPFLKQLTACLNGVPFGEAVGGLVSALMLLIIGSQASPEAQDAILSTVVSTMQSSMQNARSIATPATPVTIAHSELSSIWDRYTADKAKAEAKRGEMN